MAFSCLECMRRFSQVVLIIINIVVACLGLAVMIIGIWAKVSGAEYFEIAADSKTQFTQVSVVLIVIGLFVIIIGVVGAVGAVFASTVFGRITLGLYSVVLGLLVVCEIAAGIAAAVKRGSVEDVFRQSANATFKDIPNDDSKLATWESFQTTFKCCGVEGYMDYRFIFANNTVPESCCNKSIENEFLCDGERLNVTDNADGVIYNQGCVDAVIGELRHNLGAIAGGAIFLGLIQIVGIVMACFVAIYKRQENKYEVV